MFSGEPYKSLLHGFSEFSKKIVFIIFNYSFYTVSVFFAIISYYIENTRGFLLIVIVIYSLNNGNEYYTDLFSYAKE